MWGICQSCLCSLPLCGQLKQVAISVTVAFVWITCFQYCRKYVFKGSWWTITPDIVFLFCTALFYILMSLLQMHYIFLALCVAKTKMPLTVLDCHTILIENVCRLLYKSMLPNYVHQVLCKVEAQSSGIICGSREIYFKGKCSLKISIRHE